MLYGNEPLDMKSKIIIGGVLGSSAVGAGVITGAKVVSNTDRDKKSLK